MNIAVNLEDSPIPKSHEDLDLESEEDFKSTLRNWCGLFVSIYDAQIYLLHQTAREFLRSEAEAGTDGLYRWRGSIVGRHANALLGYICMMYLNFSEFNPQSKLPERVGFTNDARRYALFMYAATNWPYHYGLAGEENRKTFNLLAFALCKQVEIGVPSWLLVWREYDRRGRYVFPFSPLTLACAFGLDNIVNQLITAEDGDHFDSIGHAPLYYASFSSNLIQILLKAGLDINMANHTGLTTLHQLAKDDDSNGIRNLLRSGAYIDPRDKDQETPLHKAARRYRLESLRELLEEGADVNAQDCLGNTALHIWLSRDDKYNVGIGHFLERGADIHRQNLEGLTVLHIGAYYERTEEVKFLLDHGAKVDEKDLAGRTALHWAAAIGATGTTRVLLDAGADINARRNDGDSPLDRALHWKHTLIVPFLLSQGAIISMEDIQRYETSVGCQPRILRKLQDHLRKLG